MIEYLLLGLSLGVSIEPASIEVIRRGLRGGFTAGFPVAIGASMGDFFYLTLVFFGLSGFMAFTNFATVFWAIGGVILIYLAFRNIQEFRGKLKIQGKERKGNGILVGFTLAALSPVTITFWIALYGSILLSVGRGMDALFGGLLVIFGALFVMFVLSVSLHWGRRLIDEKRLRCVSLVAALMLGGFGILFILRALGLNITLGI